MRMPDPIRILCLHGFTSNGAVHAYQARKITSLFNLPSSSPPKYEFLFPDGPHLVPPSSIKDSAWHSYVSANSTAGHRGWWFARDSNFTDSSFIDPNTGGYYGLEESMKAIGRLIEETGPVHAIWGFSQGACLAGALMALLSAPPGELTDPLAKELRAMLPEGQGVPRAGVFFSGFRARFERYHGIYEGGISVPTLHVMGEDDALVSVERSRVLVGVCGEGAVELVHKNGHNLPRGDGEVERVVGFLRKNLED
jgi:pimeloyl-ACP methyl ester carboxylesterase